MKRLQQLNHDNIQHLELDVEIAQAEIHNMKFINLFNKLIYHRTSNSHSQLMHKTSWVLLRSSHWIQ